MDFAKNLMKKYGWKEGDGLGKNSDGIDKPLRANYKFDTSGLGHDPAADFNNHWWERVYNDAAKNLDVKNDAKVSLSTKSEDALEISTKDYSVKKLKKMSGKSSYNNFMKTATLSAGGESRDTNQVDIEDIGTSKYEILSDEQLFAACGGRTAHKGARHGLKSSGKLARIEQQERELLQKMQNQSTSTTDDDPSLCNESTSGEWQKRKKNKSKRKHTSVSQENEDELARQENEDELAHLLHSADYVFTSTKKRKSANRLGNDLSSCLEMFKLEQNPVSNDDDAILEAPSNENRKRSKDKKAKKTKRKNRQYSYIEESVPSSEVEGNSNISDAVRETLEELEDQLTVNSLEVNFSEPEDNPKKVPRQKKKNKIIKRERRRMKQLVHSLQNSVTIAD